MYAGEAYDVHPYHLRKVIGNPKYLNYESKRPNSNRRLETFALPSDVVVDVGDLDPTKYYRVGNIDPVKMGCKTANCIYDFPTRIFLPYDVPKENNAVCKKGLLDVYDDPGISVESCTLKDASNRYFRPFTKRSTSLLDKSVEEGGNTIVGAKVGGLSCSQQLTVLPPTFDTREIYEGASSPGFCVKTDAVCDTSDELIYSVDAGINPKGCSFRIDDIRIVGAYFSPSENYANNVTVRFREIWSAYKTNPTTYTFQITKTNLQSSIPTSNNILFVYYTIGTHPKVFSIYGWENWMFDFTPFTDQVSLLNLSESCSDCSFTALNDVNIVSSFYTPSSNFNFSNQTVIDPAKSIDASTIVQRKWAEYMQNSDLVFSIDTNTFGRDLSVGTLKSLFVLYTIYSFNPNYIFIAQGVEGGSFDFTQITKNVYDRTRIRYRKLNKVSDSILDSSRITKKEALFGGKKCSEQIGVVSPQYPSWKLIGLGKTGPSYCPPLDAVCQLQDSKIYTDPILKVGMSLDQIQLQNAYYGSDDGFTTLLNYATLSQEIYLYRNATDRQISLYNSIYSEEGSSLFPPQGTNVLSLVRASWNMYILSQSLLDGIGWKNVPFTQGGGVWAPIDMSSNCSISIFNKTMLVISSTSQNIWYTLDYTALTPVWIQFITAVAASVDLSNEYMFWSRDLSNIPWRGDDVRTTVYTKPCGNCSNNYQTVAKDNYHYEIDANLAGGGNRILEVNSANIVKERNSTQFPNPPFKYLSIDGKPGLTNVGVYIDSRNSLIYIESFDQSKWQDRSSKGQFIKVSMFDYAVAMIGTDRNVYFSPDIRTNEAAFLIAYGPASSISLYEATDGTRTVAYVSAAKEIRYATIGASIGRTFTPPIPDPAPGKTKSILVTYRIQNLPTLFSTTTTDISNLVTFDNLRLMLLTRFKDSAKQYNTREVTIVHACYYGGYSTTIGIVTSVIRDYYKAYLINPSSRFPINNNTMMGDTFPGYLKRLYITFKVGDITTTFIDSSVAEGGTLDFSYIKNVVDLFNMNTTCIKDTIDGNFYRPWDRISTSSINSSIFTTQKANNGGKTCAAQLAFKPVTSVFQKGTSSPQYCSPINGSCLPSTENQNINYTFSSNPTSGLFAKQS